MTSPVTRHCPSPEAIEAVAAGSPPSPEMAVHLANCEQCAQLLENERFARRFGAVLSDEFVIDRPAASAFPFIAGYEIIEELARGGQAIIYRGVQLRTRQPVAIKLIHWISGCSRSARARFSREIEIAGALSHPGIVRPLDSFPLADGREALILELIDGLPLPRWLSGPAHPTPFQIAAVIAEIGDALMHAHQRGVIHRDLKPSNILIDRTGRPRVLDFGVASWAAPRTAQQGTAPPTERLTLTGEFSGTLAYAAPEQLAARAGAADTRCDIYSLGVIAYEALAGRLPYDVDGPLEETVSNILHVDPARLEGINADLAAVVLKAIAKEPGRRYQTAAAFALDLRHAISGDAIDARQNSSFYVLRKTMRRHRFAATTASLVVVAAITVMAVLISSNEQLSAALAERTIGHLRALTATGARAQAEHILWPQLSQLGLDAADAREAAASLWSGSLPRRRMLWAFVEMQSLAQCESMLRVPTTSPKTARFLEDGRLGVLNGDGTAMIINAMTHEIDAVPVVLPDDMADASFTPSGNFIVHGTPRDVRCLDARTGECVASVPIDTTSGFASLAVTDKIASATTGSTAAIYSIPDLKPVRVIEGLQPGQRPWLAPDAHAFIWIDQDRRFHVTDLTGEMADRITTLPEESDAIGPDVGARITNIAAHPSGSFVLASTSNATLVVPLDGGGPAHRLPGGPRYRVVLAVSPDGRLATISAGGVSRLQIWDTATWAECPPLPGHDMSVLVHGVRHDGQMLFTLDASAVLRLWTTPQASWRHAISAPTLHALDLASTPDGRTIYASDSLGLLAAYPALALSSPTPAATRTTLPVLPARTLALSPRADQLAVSAGKADVSLVSLSDGSVRAVQLDPAHTVQQVRFSPDSATVAACTNEHGIFLVDVASASVTARFDEPAPIPGRQFSAIRFSSDGQILAASARDGTLWVFPLAEHGAALRDFRQIAASTRAIRALEFSPDGRVIAAAGNAGQVILVDVASGALRASARLSDDDLTAITFHPEGHAVIAADRSGGVIVLDSQTLIPLAVFNCGAPVTALHMDAARNALYVAALDRPIERWEFGALVEPLPRVRPSLPRR